MAQKICCGGFELGDGLELNGVTLSATGGGADSPFVVVNVTNVDGKNITFDKTGAEIKEIANSGKMPICNISGFLGLYNIGTDGDKAESNAGFVAVVGRLGSFIVESVHLADDSNVGTITVVSIEATPIG